METEIILVISFIVIILYAAAKSKSGKDVLIAKEDSERNKNESFYQKIIDEEPSENAREALKKVKEMFDAGDSFEYPDILVRAGVPREIAYSKDSDKIDAYLKFGNEKANHLFNIYRLEVFKRYGLNRWALSTIDDAFDKYKLVLNEGEVLYALFSGIYFLQEKTVRQKVTYSGMRWNSGMLRAGTLSYSSRDITDVVVQDYGRLFVTNRRIIFVGGQKNISETMSITSIVDYYLYKDGILICRNNRKNVLFIEAQYNNYDQPEDDYCYLLNDFPLQFTSIIGRIANKTENVEVK
jgi:hypothetical protein